MTLVRFGINQSNFLRGHTHTQYLHKFFDALFVEPTVGLEDYVNAITDTVRKAVGRQ